MIVHEVEQGSPEWYAIRAGKPTASEFSNIVTSKGDLSKSISTYALTLAAELYAGEPVDRWEGNSWTDRGKELEAEAIARYEFENDVAAIPVGFVTSDDGNIGCSPDRLVGEDGLIEVKCLKAEKHIEAILYFKNHSKCPTTYVQQTQGQIWITGRKWCDLYFYHPQLPCLTITQVPDDAVISGLKIGISQLIKERDFVVNLLRCGV